MAALITHAVLASKLYQIHFSDKDKKSFIIATLFPDIRYLGVIDRDKTHTKTESLDYIKKSSSFEAGFLLHTYIYLSEIAFRI